MKRIVIPAQVRAADVVQGVPREELEVVASALEDFRGVPADPDEPLEQRVVWGLLNGHMDAGECEQATAAYAHVFREQGIDPDRWLRLLAPLRITNDPGFCVPWDLSVSSDLFRCDEDDVLMPEAPPITMAGNVYALPLEVNVSLKVSGYELLIPRPERSFRALRPALLDSVDLCALAEHLAPRVHATFGGEQRLKAEPVLGPVCAMAASVRAIMMATRRGTMHLTHRPHVLGACLDALDLGPHRQTAERILLRDHPAHLAVVLTDLPEHIAPAWWHGGLSFFARNDKGVLVDVSIEERRQLFPRVLFSLAGPEPY